MNLWTWLINHRLLGILRSYLARFFFKGSWWRTIIPMCDEVLSSILTNPPRGLVYRKHHGNAAGRWRTNQIIHDHGKNGWWKSPFQSIYNKKKMVGFWVPGSSFFALVIFESWAVLQAKKENNHCETETAAVLDFFCSRKRSGVLRRSTKRSRLENWNPSPLWCWYTLQ